MAEPVQYRTVKKEVEAFRRNLSPGLKRHDALGHVMTLKNPATPGGELRAAISQSVAKQMIDYPNTKPSFETAFKAYESERVYQIEENLRLSKSPDLPRIPEATLKKWFDLSEGRMEENIRRWGRSTPKDTNYGNLRRLKVPQKWS